MVDLFAIAVELLCKDTVELMRVLSATACGQNCKNCDNNGADKCDPGKCDDKFVFDSGSMTCKGN